MRFLKDRMGLLAAATVVIVVVIGGCAGGAENAADSGLAALESIEGEETPGMSEAGEGSGEHGGGEAGERRTEGSGEHGGERGERSGEHGGEESGEQAEEGEESGTQYGLNDSYDVVRAGARLILTWDAEISSFVGTVENTTEETLTRVRVEVHLSNGVELGPTNTADMAPGEKRNVKLTAKSTNFETWSAHPEVGEGEGGLQN